ncbi:MAG TPA: isochorismate synthase, partial [Acidimicrobiales bacterium]|nr:isochorismate synthase [Acidimicrobiales bacterium]
RTPEGTSWLTVTAPDLTTSAVEEIGHRLTDPPKVPEPAGPRHYQVRSDTEPDRWCRAVADAADAVAAGRLEKVVLAREVTVVADRPLRPSVVARHLRTSQPTCMVFAVDGFVGASPELLVERRGIDVRSHPLAGTAATAAPVGSGEAVLLSSSKDLEEHRLVVDAVTAALGPYCDDLRVPATPSVVPVGGLVHLGTAIEGLLRPPGPNVLELVGAMHPTPAVGGTPTATALDYIAEVERLDRGRYAGPVGWMDGAGDGCWAVGIRSAQISGRRARLLAGAGVVAGSDPVAELAETEMKLQPMLAAIVRP